MAQTVFKATLRTLRKRTLYSAINLFGLTLGVLCALCIYALVSHELRFDDYHAQAERTYRVGALWPEWDEDGPSYQAQTPTGLVPLVREGVPGVDRVAELQVSYGSVSVRAADRYLSQDGLSFVSPDFFDVFDYTVRAGSVERLVEPNAAVLTAATAARYYGDGDPIGETIRLGAELELEVVGVVADPPAETHLPFQVFASMATRAPAYDEWGFSDGYTLYVVLDDGADAGEVETQLNAIRTAHQTEEQRAEQQFMLQPLADIHTTPEFGAYPGSYVTDPVTLWALALIGLLILLSAVVNYVNLATAQGAARAKEIGVRKAIGGTRGQIAGQLMGETGLLTLGAVAAGWLAAVALVPAAGGLFGVEVEASALLHPGALGFTGLVAVVVSGLAGWYPAVVLSRYRPTVVLRGSGGGRRSGAIGFRQGLIVFQFVATLALL
ncbi:ABC transporter permease, partial [Rubrivirga sp.]|uniref:ABC transporter permease n=1 Tax=Rubrivirga sp. TaxID=1885344 RepID=UPI003C7959D3